MRRTVLLLTVMGLALVLASGLAWAATKTGTRRQRQPPGTADNDRMYGLDGNDTLDGRGGNDEISGGAGVDTLYGKAGNDEMYGGSGNDKLYGGGSADTFGGDEWMYGGSGDDILDFKYSYAEAYGGPGKDTLYANNGLEDEVYGGTGNDTMYADDDTYDYIDCGEYQTGSFNKDVDTATVDRKTQFTTARTPPPIQTRRRNPREKTRYQRPGGTPRPFSVRGADLCIRRSSPAGSEYHM
jgi:Ca2+-binding RTX toxin-like protein